MKKLSLSIITLCVLALFGCSKLKNENPVGPAPVVGVHAEGFKSPDSPNFHGNIVGLQSGDTQPCTKCHGSDYNGTTDNNGIVTPSCNACHRHAEGVVDPASPNFHGKFIAAANYNLSTCKKCHGTTYSGGMSGRTCLTCHSKDNGPENCTTCHGSSDNAAPPVDLAGNTSSSARAVGAHQAHLNQGDLGAALGCSTCHNVPDQFSSPGHIDNTPHAQIHFDTAGIAYTQTNVPGTPQYTASMPVVVPTPTYSAAAIQCSNTYCHGNFKNGNPSNAVVWNNTSTSVTACGTCHGDVTKTTLADKARPKTTLNGGSHPSTTIACVTCHSDVVDANMTIIDPTKHINGKLNVFHIEEPF